MAGLDGSARVLSRIYPDALFETLSAADDPEQRYETLAVCDLAAIQSNRALLSDIADSYSRYSAYIEIGLVDTHEEYVRLHELLDQRLGIAHGETDS